MSRRSGLGKQVTEAKEWPWELQRERGKENAPCAQERVRTLGKEGQGEGTGVLIEKECAGGFVFHPDGFSLEDSGEDLNAAGPEVRSAMALLSLVFLPFWA